MTKVIWLITNWDIDIILKFHFYQIMELSEYSNRCGRTDKCSAKVMGNVLRALHNPQDLHIHSECCAWTRLVINIWLCRMHPQKPDFALKFKPITRCITIKCCVVYASMLILVPLWLSPSTSFSIITHKSWMTIQFISCIYLTRARLRV